MEDKWFEAREALVTFVIAGLTLDRTVYCIPGADLYWETALAMKSTDDEDFELFTKCRALKKQQK